MDLRELKEFLKDSFIYIIIFVIVFLVLLYVVAFEQVHGSSMKPNYENSNVVLLSKVIYNFHKIEAQDVVALTDPDGVLYIKRVIAGPGDKVYATNGSVYVNDEKLKEEYLSDVITEDFTFDEICRIDGCDKGYLPKNKYFVLGDNRPDSYDSRYNVFGLIDKENILGKVIFKVWPFGFAK